MDANYKKSLKLPWNGILILSRAGDSICCEMPHLALLQETCSQKGRYVYYSFLVNWLQRCLKCMRYAFIVIHCLPKEHCTGECPACS
jgi:hypothetical protein